MGTGYYVPSFFVHLFAMFMPSLLFGGTYHRLVMGLVFVSGPLMTEYIMWGGSQDVRAHEWQGVWCLFSAAQVSLPRNISSSRPVLALCQPSEHTCMQCGRCTWCAECRSELSCLRVSVPLVAELLHPGYCLCHALGRSPAGCVQGLNAPHKQKQDGPLGTVYGKAQPLHASSN